MKGKVKGAFKSYIFCQKKPHGKPGTGSAWKFPQPPKNRGAYIPNFKIKALIFCAFLFLKNISTLRSG